MLKFKDHERKEKKLSQAATVQTIQFQKISTERDRELKENKDKKKDGDYGCNLPFTLNTFFLSI